MNIELYIANKLCDLSSSDTDVTLKRQFLNPEALNAKDSQKSYEIILPATPTNNEIFRYVNVEEVGDKFKIYPNARLYVGGVLILDGKFRLSEIGRDSYKGNLGVPKILSAKDVFGDMMLNNAGNWKIDNFRGLEGVSEYNLKDNAPVIFPLVLYGLLPKLANDNGDFTDKNKYDESVVLGLDDFLPSVNCIEMLKKVFSNSGYNLSGTALTDDRLTNLYMSYKNPNEYQFDWGVGSMSLSGRWAHYDSQESKLESKYSRNIDNKQYACNIFNSRNNKPIVKSDTGGNIRINGERTTITVPRSGLYKIHLNSSVEMANYEHLSYSRIGVKPGNFNDAPMELHLVRNLDKTLSDINFNNKFSYDNINQKINDEYAIFPQPHRVNFIDPKIDKNFLCGFSFGKHSDENYRNPLNGDNCNPMAITGGRSWDFDDGNGVIDRSYSAVYSPSYKNREGINQDRFTVELNNADTKTIRFSDTLVLGDVYQIVWLEKGEQLDLITTTTYTAGTTLKPYPYIYGYTINYRIDIEPFYRYLNWLKIDTNGNSTEAMDWNYSKEDNPEDNGFFVENQIDLIQSLPSEMKVNDWIDNFCKAFNLILYNTGGKNFNLDIKDKGTVGNTSIIIDLDNKVNVNQALNQPLNLPYVYELGFTVDNSEEGYFRSITEFDKDGEPILASGDNGGGMFETGSHNTSKISQMSSFSYCWYKDIEYTRDGSTLRLPVITDKEIWKNDYDYKEMLSKLYLDKGLRFWYKSGVKELDLGLDRTATVALVSNEYNGDHKQTLNYRNEPNTIMSNYFLLLTNRKYYTVVECYLSPEEYSNLDIALVRFNGDLYNIAEIDGYDPLGRRKCTLKLIRKI